MRCCCAPGNSSGSRSLTSSGVDLAITCGRPGSHLCTKHDCPSGAALVTRFGLIPLLLRPIVGGSHDLLVHDSLNRHHGASSAKPGKDKP